MIYYDLFDISTKRFLTVIFNDPEGQMGRTHVMTKVETCHKPLYYVAFM